MNPSEEVLKITMAFYLDAIAREDPSRKPHPADDPAALERAYASRNACIVMAVSAAMQLGWPSGFAANPDDPDWPVAYIELPEVGQVSWHLPAYPGTWDRHTVAEKYARVRGWLDRFDASTSARPDHHRVPEAWERPDHLHVAKPGES
jgi:hypothetical protein